MSAKTSIQVTAWEKAGRFLLSAFEGPQGRRVASKMINRARKGLAEGEADPPFLGTLLGLAVIVKTGLAELVAFDDLLFKAEALLTSLVGKRDDLFKKVSSLIAGLRQSVDGQFVSPRWDLLGLESRTGRTIEHVLRQAQRLGLAAEDGDLAEILGEPKFDGFDPKPNILVIVATAKELETASTNVDDARRNRDEAQIDRNNMLAEYQLTHVHSARTFESWCRLVGENKLAEKVRPPVIKPRSNDEGESGEGDGAVTAPPEPDVTTPPQVGEDASETIVATPVDTTAATIGTVEAASASEEGA